MVEVVERRRQVRVQHPQPLAAGTPSGHKHRLDRVMAASTGPKPVRSGLKPGLPLGLQRADRHRLQTPVDDHGYPQRALFPACLGDEHAPHRHRRPRAVVTLHPAGQTGLVLGCQRYLPVHAGRATPGVELGDPPNAQQGVRAGPQQQLLQVTDPPQVPCLGCREDPLTQSSYVALNLPPIHSVPVKDGALRSVHHRARRHSGVQLAHRFRPHVPRIVTGSPDPRQRPFEPGHQPVSGQLCGDHQRRSWHSGPRVPVAFRHAGIRLLGHRSPAAGLGLPHGRLTGPRAGPQRGCRVAHAQAATGQDASFTPGTVVRSRPATTLQPAPAAFQRPVPTALLLLPIGRGHFHEASPEVHSRSPLIPPASPPPGPGSTLPAGLLLACGPRMEPEPLGVFPELRTPRLPATHVEAETGHRALARVLHLQHQPNLHRCLPLALMHPHVAHSRRWTPPSPSGSPGPPAARPAG
jgi:hypothetical protein